MNLVVDPRRFPGITADQIRSITRAERVTYDALARRYIAEYASIQDLLRDSEAHRILRAQRARPLPLDRRQ